jgi:hypothetical protein
MTGEVIACAEKSFFRDPDACEFVMTLRANPVEKKPGTRPG